MTNTPPTANSPTAARIFLESLKANGVDYIFANAGTDFAPILETLLAPDGAADMFPEFIICPHENLAVAMAQGYYLATGRAQAAMVHVNVGVANAMCGLLNAARDNVPILFASGRTPITEYGRLGSRDNFIHWGQEMFDQGAMLREFVKWDYELRTAEQTQAVVNRAHAIAMSEPKGPVYISLPREVLASSVKHGGVSPAPAAPASKPTPDPSAIAEAARMIASAKQPLIITARAGCSADGMDALGQLAEKFAIPVVEFAANYVCLPTNHPMHAGFSPAPYMQDTDLIIVIDAAVPWAPTRVMPQEDCKVIHMGPDPLYAQIPYRGFRSDLTISTEISVGLNALCVALTDHPGLVSSALKKRYDLQKAQFAKARAERLSSAAMPGATISHEYASHCINEALGEEGILVNERGCLRAAMQFVRPGTFFGPSIAGGLGASIGIALGIKIANPDALVAAALGDGSFIFNNPLACLQVSNAHNLPLLITVLNNDAWHSVKASTIQVYPDGEISRSNNPPLTSLAPSPNYSAVARACGAQGVRVDDPKDLKAVLKQAVNNVHNNKKTVLIDIAIDQS